MSVGIYQDFKILLDAKVREMEEHIARGGVPDFAAYKEKVGAVKGMKKAWDIFKDAHSKHMTIDEEDNGDDFDDD